MKTAPTRLERGGVVRLRAGWSIILPPCHHQRNADGSWSAWGGDWALDLHVVEARGGDPASMRDVVGGDLARRIEGEGWVGTTEIRREMAGDGPVFRLASTLAADRSRMSCGVSYFSEDKAPFAQGLVDRVTHRPGLLARVFGRAPG